MPLEKKENKAPPVVRRPNEVHFVNNPKNLCFNRDTVRYREVMPKSTIITDDMAAEFDTQKINLGKYEAVNLAGVTFFCMIDRDEIRVYKEHADPTTSNRLVPVGSCLTSDPTKESETLVALTGRQHVVLASMLTSPRSRKTAEDTVGITSPERSDARGLAGLLKLRAQNTPGKSVTKQIQRIAPPEVTQCARQLGYPKPVVSDSQASQATPRRPLQPRQIAATKPDVAGAAPTKSMFPTPPSVQRLAMTGLDAALAQAEAQARMRAQHTAWLQAQEQARIQAQQAYLAQQIREQQIREQQIREQQMWEQQIWAQQQGGTHFFTSTPTHVQPPQYFAAPDPNLCSPEPSSFFPSGPNFFSPPPGQQPRQPLVRHTMPAAQGYPPSYHLTHPKQ